MYVIFDKGWLYFEEKEILGGVNLKKLLIANVLLLLSLIYLVFVVTQPSLYLPDYSINISNPVSFHWTYIEIDTGYEPGDSSSIDRISMTPIFFVVLIALILTALSFNRKDKWDPVGDFTGIMEQWFLN